MAAPAKAKSEKSVEEVVIARLISKMEATGTVFWKRSYTLYRGDGSPRFEVPKNFYTGASYSGINIFLLMGGSGFYITASQLKAYNKANNSKFWFKAGTPQDTIVFAKSRKSEITAEKARELIAQGYSRYVIKEGDKYYQLFIGYVYHSVIDCIHIADDTGKPLLPPIEDAPEVTVEEKKAMNVRANAMMQGYMAATGVTMRTKQGTPHYKEAGDYISLPDFKYFRNEEAYYRDAFHELLHSTGISSRLNRPEFKNYSKRTDRSREELVAEVGSMLIVAGLGYDPNGEEADNSENYVKNWCEWMKNNPKEMFRSLSETQKAVTYLTEKAQGVTVPAPAEAVVEASQEAKAERIPTTRKELLEYLAALSEKNNNRGTRTMKRIADAGRVKELAASFEPADVHSGLIVFPITVSPQLKIEVGMSYAITTDTNGKSQILYSLERGDSQVDAEAIAAKSKHVGFMTLVSYMDFRKKIK